MICDKEIHILMLNHKKAKVNKNFIRLFHGSNEEGYANIRHKLHR